MTYCPESRFEREICTACGTCISVCPTGAAVAGEGGLPEFRGSYCIGCGHCGAYCPENAFGLEAATRKPPGFGIQVYRELLSARRSVRQYSPKVPGEEELTELLSVMDQCPTGRNAQGMEVRVLLGREHARRLSSSVTRLAKLLRRTGVARLLGWFTPYGEMLVRLSQGEDIVFREAPVVMFFFVPKRNPTCRTDGVIAAATVMQHATAMGLGTFWNGVAERLYPIFRSWHTGARRGMRLTAVICAGYSELEALNRVPGREYRVTFE